MAGTACVRPARAPDKPGTPAQTNPAANLARLAEQFWEEHLAADPIEGTLLGYPRFDALMPDESAVGRAAQRGRLMALRSRLDLEAPADPLSPADRLTRDLLLGEVDRELAFADCHLEEWVVDPRDGPQVAYLDLAGLQGVKTPADRLAMLTRWRAMPRAIDQRIENLRRGLEAGKTSARSEVERVARQLDELLATPDAAWPLVAPVERAAIADPTERQRFHDDLVRVVADGIRPAFTRYRALVREQLLPRARGDADVGIGHLVGGAACYTALARAHTSLAVDPAAVHATGLRELARIRAEMEALGTAAVGASTFQDLQRKLREADPARFFLSRDDVEASARETLARATAAMPRFLGRIPRTPCVVKRIQPHEEKDSPIAYYRLPAIDGSRPGAYEVNTYDPTSRPRFEAEALAFHEAIPGHHVQIALAQELGDVAEFRKHLGVTAFVEGWGLYAEGLADELGLYSGPLTRLGRLSLESWRAARLVVDTGIHALGWSRAQAVAFLRDNTLIAQNNIETEVDRYIGWPGQALAYKVGELEILRLRADARQRLGAAFDLRRFHDVVLGSGAVSLPVLAASVNAWVRAQVSPAR
ncbi:MAG TPA: DUF885 domain-containing protein [Polyangia bacterium]|nr:DUF885 domain-containing protein [Polyangia bacterium]